MQTTGARVLAENQNHRASELHAGARAELIPSPLTKSLATWRGKFMARTMRLMGVGSGIIHYAAFRPYAIMEIVRRLIDHIPASDPVVLDPAAGYGPEHIWLAAEMPHVQFIELDHPDVIEDKRERLRDYDIPSNFRMIAADLKQQSLSEALGDIRPHILIAIAAYVTTEQYLELLGYLPQVMQPEGRLLAPFPYKPGIENLMLHRLTFQDLVKVAPVGMVDSEMAIRDILSRAGYREVQIYALSSLATQMGKPLPADVELMATAQLPA